MRHHLSLLALLAAVACSEPSDPIDDDRLTTPGAAAAVTCQEVPAGTGLYSGTWDLTWYCAGYDSGDVTGLPCDPAIAAFDLADPATVVLSGLGRYDLTIGDMTITMAPGDDETDFLVSDSDGDAWLMMRDCGAEPHASLSYVQHQGPGSGTAWVAAATRRQ